MARPKASDQIWKQRFHNNIVTVYVAHDYPDFYYKVDVQGERPKYFFGETAWADYQRYAYDKTMNATMTCYECNKPNIDDEFYYCDEDDNVICPECYGY